MAELSEKQRRFVEAYMGRAAGNATEAARVAGYSDPNYGRQIITKPNVLSAIESRQASDPMIPDREERQRFWGSVMRDEKEETRDRLRASELLGKSCADFVDRKEHSGPDGGPIPVQAMATIDASRLSSENLREIRAAARGDTGSGGPEP